MACGQVVASAEHGCRPTFGIEPIDALTSRYPQAPVSRLGEAVDAQFGQHAAAYHGLEGGVLLFEKESAVVGTYPELSATCDEKCGDVVVGDLSRGRSCLVVVGCSRRLVVADESVVSRANPYDAVLVAVQVEDEGMVEGLLVYGFYLLRCVVVMIESVGGSYPQVAVAIGAEGKDVVLCQW